MDREMQDLEVVYAAENQENYGILCDNTRSNSVIGIEIQYELDALQNQKIRKYIYPGKVAMIYFPENAMSLDLVIYKEEQGEKSLLFREWLSTVQNKKYELRESQKAPYVVVYSSSCNVQFAGATNGSQPVGAAPTGNYISLNNTESDIMSLDVNYMLDNQKVSKSTGGLAMYQTKYIELPEGATQIHIAVRHALFIKTWETIYTDYYATASTHCYMVVSAGFFTAKVTEVNCYD